MFESGNVIGLGAALAGSAFETAETPALPGPGQTGLQGDGSGNFEVALDSEGATVQQTRSALDMGEQPGALTVPLDGQGGVPVGGGPWPALEPADTSGPAALRSAGFTTLLLAASVGAGVAFGGPWGGAAGLLLAAGLANGYRMQKWWDSQSASEKHEAVVSGVFGAAATGMGIYAAYKAYQSKQEED